MTKLMISEELFNWFYPIGSYYETSNTSFNPASAGWYGEWVEDTEGLTLVSRNSGTFKNVGDVIGEEKHTLTNEELPEMVTIRASTGGYGNNDWSGPRSGWGNYQNNTRGPAVNLPHNNIQPSKVGIRWHRIA